MFLTIIAQEQRKKQRKSRDGTNKKTCVIVDNEGDHYDEWLGAQIQYNIDLPGMNSAVMMFRFLILSGHLDKQHVFHQQVDRCIL